MSDPGQASQADTVITSPRLRDAVSAYKQIVRPTAVLACGLAVAWAAVCQPGNWEIVAIAATVVTGVAYFRTMDKQALTGKAG